MRTHPMCQPAFEIALKYEFVLVYRQCWRLSVLQVESVEDPVGSVKEIVRRCDKAILLSVFRIRDFNCPEEFLYLVAQKRGKLGKGGVPNLIAAARVVLREWNSGKIPYYTLPPEEGVDDHTGIKIADKNSKEFDINKVSSEAIKSDGGKAMEQDLV